MARSAIRSSRPSPFGSNALPESILPIRPAGLLDLPIIRDILVSTWHATYDAILGVDQVAAITERWHSIENLRRELEEATDRPSERAFLIAEYNGEVVATASASLSSDACLELNRLYVLPERQGRRIGDRLLLEAIRRFPEADKLRLEVEPQNGGAIAFYQNYGLRVIASGNACGGDEAAALPHLVMEGALPLTPIRLATDLDAQDLFGLITLCFAEYPGCFTDPHDDLPDLRAPGAAFKATKGAFWVTEDERGRVGACCGVDFPEDRLAEVHRLYVRPDLRKNGFAGRLLEKAEHHARAGGADAIIAWSDTRFETAHAFYAKRGYERGTEPRVLQDISHSSEFFFKKRLVTARN